MALKLKTLFKKNEEDRMEALRAEHDELLPQIRAVETKLRNKVYQLKSQHLEFYPYRATYDTRYAEPRPRLEEFQIVIPSPYLNSYGEVNHQDLMVLPMLKEPTEIYRIGDPPEDILGMNPNEEQLTSWVLRAKNWIRRYSGKESLLRVKYMQVRTFDNMKELESAVKKLLNTDATYFDINGKKVTSND
jgi:hypothetical protein